MSPIALQPDVLSKAPEASGEIEDPKLREATLKWLESAQSLPERNREIFKRHVMEMSKDVSTSLKRISHLSKSADALSTEGIFSLEKMNRVAQDLFEKCKTYDASKGEVLLRLDRVQGQIDSTKVNLDPFKKPASSSSSWEDALFRYRQERMMEKMVAVKTASVVLDLAAKPFEWAGEAICNMNATTREECRKMEDAIAPVAQKVQKWNERTSENTAQFISRELNLPIHMTREYVSDSNNVAAGLAAAGALKAVAQPLKMLKPKRLQYANGYERSAAEFLNPPKEFKGALSKDLVVVQYHSDVALHAGRSYKWFMPAMEANKLMTVEEVMNNCALLTKFGERTHVSVARIPAGEKVKFLHGKAKPQLDPVKSELREGGGIQYRFFDFDPKWIVETRPLPSK